MGNKKNKKFKVIWQSKIHNNIQVEIFDSYEKALGLVNSLIKNSKMLCVEWIESPKIKEFNDYE